MSGPMHAHAAGDVAQEAGDAEAHVGGISELHQSHRNEADDQSGEDHQQIFLVFHWISPFSV